MEPIEIMKIEKGTVLNASWGYDMTINDFCIVIEVSPTGKTALCRMIGKDLVSGDDLQGSVKANTTEMFGKPFRVRIKDNYAVGSYPFCATAGDHTDENKRKGFFKAVKNDQTFYENHLD